MISSSVIRHSTEDCTDSDIQNALMQSYKTLDITAALNMVKSLCYAMTALTPFQTILIGNDIV